MEKTGFCDVGCGAGARFTKDLRCILHPKLGRKMIFAKKLRFTKGS